MDKDNNVLAFRGAMRPRPYVRIKLTEAELDAQIAANRQHYDDACNAEAPGPRMAPLRRPSVIPLDGSWLGRVARWLRGLR